MWSKTVQFKDESKTNMAITLKCEENSWDKTVSAVKSSNRILVTISKHVAYRHPGPVPPHPGMMGGPPQARPHPLHPGYRESPHYDEYCGLMSTQEKQWLYSIQMLQLNSTNPYQDDYYYIMYQQRQQGVNMRKIGNYGNRTMREGPSKPAASYVPLQFENSLGKLQIGSVTAPRRIIETEFFENNSVGHPADLRKSKQLLYEIEKMYNDYLTMEQLASQMFSRNLNANCKQASDIKTIGEGLMKQLLQGNLLVKIMYINKGRGLVRRLLPMLNDGTPLISKFLENLSSITCSQRNALEHIMSLLPRIRSYLSTCNMQVLLSHIRRFSPHDLFSSKFVTSVMTNFVMRVDELMQRDQVSPVERVVWVDTLAMMAHCASREWSELYQPVVAAGPDIVQRQTDLLRGVVDSDSISKLARALSLPCAATPAANSPDNQN